jgi:hypothetical protein
MARLFQFSYPIVRYESCGGRSFLVGTSPKLLSYRLEAEASRAEDLAVKCLGIGIFMEGVAACSISPPIASSAASDLALDDCVGVGIPEGYWGSLTAPRALDRFVLPPPVRVRALLKVVTEPLLTVRWCVETCIASRSFPFFNKDSRTPLLCSDDSINVF